MIVPLMIWSALTEIDNQAWTSDTMTPDRTARGSVRRPASGWRRRAASGRAEDRLEIDPRGPADERRDQHRPLDADVDDARPFAHDAAQSGEPIGTDALS